MESMRIINICKAVNAGSIPAPASNLRSIDDTEALVAGKRDYRASEGVCPYRTRSLAGLVWDAAGEGMGRMSWGA